MATRFSPDQIVAQQSKTPKTPTTQRSVLYNPPAPTIGQILRPNASPGLQNFTTKRMNNILNVTPKPAAQTAPAVSQQPGVVVPVSWKSPDALVAQATASAKQPTTKTSQPSGKGTTGVGGDKTPASQWKPSGTYSPDNTGRVDNTGKDEIPWRDLEWLAEEQRKAGERSATSNMAPEASRWFGESIRGFDGLLQAAMQSGADAQAMVLAGLERTMSMLNEMESQWIARFQGQGTADDPQVRAAIGLIREEVARQREELIEYMNSRGLAQSGILLEMMDRVNRNELTQTQQLIAGRISELQSQLNSALIQFANARINALSNAQNQALQAHLATQGQLTDIGAQRNSAMLQFGMAEQGAFESTRNYNVDNYWRGLNFERGVFESDRAHDWEQSRWRDKMELDWFNAQAARAASEAQNRATSAQQLQANMDFVRTQVEMIWANWRNGQFINPQTGQAQTKEQLIAAAETSNLDPTSKGMLIQYLRMLPDSPQPAGTRGKGETPWWKNLGIGRNRDKTVTGTDPYLDLAYSRLVP